MPVADKSAEEGDDDGVEQWQNQQFVDECEEEHRMREGSWDPRFSQPQPILEDVTNAFNPKGKTYHHQPQSNVKLQSKFY